MPIDIDQTRHEDIVHFQNARVPMQWALIYAITIHIYFYPTVGRFMNQIKETFRMQIEWMTKMPAIVSISQFINKQTNKKKLYFNSLTDICNDVIS